MSYMIAPEVKSNSIVVCLIDRPITSLGFVCLVADKKVLCCVSSGTKTLQVNTNEYTIEPRAVATVFHCLPSNYDKQVGVTGV